MKKVTNSYEKSKALKLSSASFKQELVMEDQFT